MSSSIRLSHTSIQKIFSPHSKLSIAPIPMVVKAAVPNRQMCQMRQYATTIVNGRSFDGSSAHLSSENQQKQKQFVEDQFFSPKAKQISPKERGNYSQGRLSLLSYARLVDMSDYIHRHRANVKKRKEDSQGALVDQFRHLLFPSVYEYLKSEGIERLTDIQAKSVSTALKSLRKRKELGRSVLLASQTGTGKTLAYLLPLVHNIKVDEVRDAIGIQAHQPRALILVPSRQLASQVQRVAKSMVHNVKFRCALFRSDFKMRRMRIDAEDADVVVSTPGIWKHMCEKGFASYADMKYIVVDEADSMLDQKAFGKEVTDILSAAQKVNPNMQHFFAMATVNHSILDWTANYARTAKVLASDSVHRHVPSVQQSFIDCSQLDKLKDCLIPLVKKETEPTIIFCNTVDSARAVNLTLMENDIDTANFHAQMYPKEQHEEFEKFRKGVVQFLITTDIASRGLDMTFVKHIINFDFPKNHVDYIHRTGRTGRMGSDGRVTSLLRKHDKGLAESIKKAVQKEQRMDQISARFIRRDPKQRKLSRPSTSSRAKSKGSRPSKPSAVIGKKLAKEGPPEPW